MGDDSPEKQSTGDAVAESAKNSASVDTKIDAQATGTQTTEAQVDAAKDNADAATVDQTKWELGDFVSTLTSDLEKTLIAKYGKDNPETDRILDKVKDLAKVGLWLKIKGAVNSVLGFFGIAQKFKPDLKIPTQLTDMQEKISPLAEKIDTVEKQISDVTSGNMIEKALLQVQGIDVDQLQWDQKDTNIDTALTTLEQEAKKLKQEKNITTAKYKMWYAKLLQTFINNVRWVQVWDAQKLDAQNNTADKKDMPPQTYEDIGYMDEDYDETHIGDIEGMKYTDMIAIDNIKSNGVLKSTTGMTLCSKTARLDLEQIFGIKTPQAGSALASKDLYKKSDIAKDHDTQKDDNAVVDIKDAYEADIKWDVFDIFTKSTWAPQYGHRCWWFRSYPSGKIYVVDYYMKGDEYKKPVPIETYMDKICADKKDGGRGRSMLKIVWYDTKKQIVDDEKVVVEQQKKNPWNQERQVA